MLQLQHLRTMTPFLIRGVKISICMLKASFAIIYHRYLLSLRDAVEATRPPIRRTYPIPVTLTFSFPLSWTLKRYFYPSTIVLIILASFLICIIAATKNKTFSHPRHLTFSMASNHARRFPILIKPNQTKERNSRLPNPVPHDVTLTSLSLD